jgi:hypothetical protein
MFSQKSYYPYIFIIIFDQFSKICTKIYKGTEEQTPSKESHVCLSKGTTITTQLLFFYKSAHPHSLILLIVNPITIIPPYMIQLSKDIKIIQDPVI